MAGGKKQTIGYKYFAALHMILCHGQIDSVRQITVGENKTIIEGDLPAGTYQVSKENLFGGEKSGGGISGTIDVMSGAYTQERNGFIVSYQGERDNTKNVPGYRGVAALFLRGTLVETGSVTLNPTIGFLNNAVNIFGAPLNREGMYLGTSAYIKTFKTLVQRILKKSDGSDQWYSEKAKMLTTTSINAKGYDFELNTGSDSLGQFAIGKYNAEKALYEYSREGGQTQPDSSSVIMGTFDQVNNQELNLILSNLAEEMPEQWITAELRILTEQQTQASIVISQGISVLNSSSGTYGDGTTITTYQLSIPVKVATYNVTVGRLSGEGSISSYLSIFEPTTKNVFDINPVHIIRECITDKKWGMGEPESIIDDASFIAAADTCYSEGFGMSIVWAQEGSIEYFIGEVLRHIQAFLYVDPKTGKYTIKLARDDYGEDLIQLNSSNILSFSDFKKSVFSELVNSVTVTYKNISANTDATITVQDLALVTMMGGAIKSESIEYAGFTNSKVAGRVALRDLKTLSTPLISGELTVKRTIGLQIRQGDVVSVTWKKYHIANLKMRVEGIDYGDSRDNKVVLTVKEDIYSLPSSSTVTIDETIFRVNKDLLPVSQQISFEMPYLELVKLTGQGTTDSNLAANNFAGYLGVAAAKPGESVMYGTLYERDIPSDVFNQAENMDFCPVLFVTQPLDLYTNSVTCLNHQDLDLIESFPVWAQIDEEIVSITSITNTLLGDLPAKNISFKRGVLDTQVAEHESGKTMYIWDVAGGYSSTQYGLGEEVAAKITSATISEETEVINATSMYLTMQARAIRPYPPANVRIESQYFPTQFAGDSLQVEWSHRNRIQQTGLDYIGWYDSDIPPEEGTTYVVEIMVDEISLITETTAENNIILDVASLPLSNNVKLKITSVRNGFDCLQNFEWTLSKIAGVARAINLKAEIL